MLVVLCCLCGDNQHLVINRREQPPEHLHQIALWFIVSVDPKSIAFRTMKKP